MVYINNIILKGVRKMVDLLVTVSMIAMFGGIGLFLYGMTVMSTGLKNAAGDRLRVILERVSMCVSCSTIWRR